MRMFNDVKLHVVAAPSSKKRDRRPGGEDRQKGLASKAFACAHFLHHNLE